MGPDCSKQKKGIQNSEKQLPLKNQDHRDYQQETLIEQFVKYWELGNQQFPLFSRKEACSFGQLSLLEIFLVLKVSFSQVALSRKLWRRTGITVAVNLYTHIYCQSFL